MTFQASDFEALHADKADPWHFRTRWYEARKRALTVAMLPHAHYGLGFEPGCSIGELSRTLAPRCDRLLAWDISASALVAAASRRRTNSTIVLEQREVPGDWPDEPLDLIVISEVAYFLNAHKLQALIGRVEQSLAPEGTLILCHWRGPIAGGELDGDAVHRRFECSDRLKLISNLIEKDFRMCVMTRDGRSVAEQEGLT
jgi:SAM-dependent methyltransferase